MDIEFHYYITKALALRADYSLSDSEVIAYSSQFVDDNYKQYFIKNNTFSFRNYITQTFNILKPRKTLMHIYSIFHFIPGNKNAESAKRKDRKVNIFNCTPDSDNANAILKLSLQSNNLYRIGIAIHGFSDTFAHQNFTGMHDRFNSIPGLHEHFIPNIGHADALTKPDLVSFSWQDKRLISKNMIIFNNLRFIQAAKRVFEELAKFNSKSSSWIEKTWEVLSKDLLHALGKKDLNQLFQNERIDNYKSIFGVDSFYDKNKWFNEAIETKGFLNEHFTFRKGFKNSHWFQFQDAVFKHQEESWNILKKYFGLNGMEMERKRDFFSPVYGV